MSMMYCEAHDKQIDTDFDAEHFDDYDPLTGEHSTLRELAQPEPNGMLKRGKEDD